MTHLIARLYDATSGTVSVAGADVRGLQLAVLRDAVGYVTQDAHMFHDTIRDNLGYARPEVSDERMWEVLRRRADRRSGRQPARRAGHGGRGPRVPVVRR